MKRGVVGEKDWNEDHFQFLIRAPTKKLNKNPLPWLPNSAWGAISSLSELDEFSKFTSDLIEAAPRFHEWFNSISPEKEKLPLDLGGLDREPFHKILVDRCINFHLIGCV